MPDLAKCRCKRLSWGKAPVPCGALATQEDMLCDECRPRPGSACLALFTPEGKPLTAGHSAYSSGNFQWDPESSATVSSVSVRWPEATVTIEIPLEPGPNGV